ncbi:MAG TPA: hypothetical protein VMV83_08035 [Rectinemataceae bacterium]|nr:hypothetical protein [Rectinemataceae bacterium]
MKTRKPAGELRESRPGWSLEPRPDMEGGGGGARLGAVTVAAESLAEASIELDAETEGINTFAESALHASLKSWLARPGDRLEVSLDGKIVDLLRADGECVEVQTKRLDRIVPKVLSLARQRPVRVVHPVLAAYSIIRLDPATGEVESERKGPRRGDLWSVFDELVMSSGLIAARNVTVEVLLVKAREIRTRDGKWTWRKKGDRVLSRELVEVLESRSLRGRSGWLGLLPRDLAWPCDSASLGEALGIGGERARKVLYCYAKAGLLVEAGKQGRRKAYELAKAPSGPTIRRRKSSSGESLPVGGP